MVGEVARAARTAGMFIGICLAVVLIGSAVIAHFSTWQFYDAFGLLVIMGGVMLMYGGAMTGAGGAEKGALTAAHMTGGHHSKYYEQYAGERQSRRDSQFWYMLLMVASGAILLALGFIVLG